jgi:hypothetical protein
MAGRIMSAYEALKSGSGQGYAPSQNITRYSNSQAVTGLAEHVKQQSPPSALPSAGGDWSQVGGA